MGEVAATPKQLHAILEQHRDALQVGPAYATGLSAVGPMAMIEGDIRIDKALPELKRGFADLPSELCFGVQIETGGSPPEPY